MARARMQKIPSMLIEKFPMAARRLNDSMGRFTHTGRQPDFAAVWREYFGGTPAKVTYKLRRGANRFHDLVFLTSLVHDARFKREDVRLRGKRLTIPIERDCWELFSRAKREEFYVTAARLTFFPISQLEWQFKHGAKFGPKDELWIQELWLDRSTDSTQESARVIIFGFAWRCLLTVRDTDLRIQLQDLKVPNLFSERPTSPRRG